MARTILEGHASRVVADLNAHARARGLHEDSKSAQLPGLQGAIAYLKAEQPCLGYDLALALGWPIATRVIEGCCRYLIKDRLHVTGARWSLTGAEAVLLLRAVIDNGDFNAYWEYHGRLEHERQHTVRYQQDFVVAASPPRGSSLNGKRTQREYRASLAEGLAAQIVSTLRGD